MRLGLLPPIAADLGRHENDKACLAPLRVAALFAGIGGIEVGLHAAGHATSMFCEIDPAAQAVLRHQFPRVALHPDIRDLSRLPDVDLVSAGFPCQDLSQAGRTMGIRGNRSGLVDDVFELLRSANPRWLLLENVPFMLQLDGGQAMRYLTDRLGELGFQWAYRVVDSRAFGLPQRRQRVLLLASRTEDPASVLYADDSGEPWPQAPNGLACGFYWTEGIRGLGWAVDAIPTLKSGSTIGIPSPPAIWMPDGFVGTPDIRDAERLQGFEPDWTRLQSNANHNKGARWRLVGNAVSVPVAKWLGDRLLRPGRVLASDGKPIKPGDSWPRAAWGRGRTAYSVDISAWPAHVPRRPLTEFLAYPLKPLSVRAAEGFLGRASRSTLHFPEGLLEAIRVHMSRMRESAAA